MHVGLLIATAIGWAVLCPERSIGGATLYPIVSSDTNESHSPIVSTQTASTNEVAAVSAFSVTLKPTSIAPAGTSGTLELKGRTLLLHLSHLNPGHYDLQIVKRSDGTFETLGRFTIADPTLGPDRQTTDNKKEASANPESVSIKTDVQMDLPSELSARDIARILLMSPGANAVLISEVK